MLRTALLVATALAVNGTPNDCLRIGSARVSAYFVMNGRSDTSCGDVDDMRRAAESEADGYQGVWFRLDGQEWVVRDPAVVTAARNLFRKVNELGKRMAIVGSEPSVLSAEMRRDLATARSGLSVLLEKAAKDGKAETVPL
jgi:hypothetical protein